MHVHVCTYTYVPFVNKKEFLQEYQREQSIRSYMHMHMHINVLYKALQAACGSRKIENGPAPEEFQDQFGNTFG